MYGKTYHLPVEMEHIAYCTIKMNLDLYAVGIKRKIQISKLISKVLANRLQPRIADLIDNMQSSFIKKRSITKNFLLASELVQCALRRKKPMNVLKLDFHKAFDTINWGCIMMILQHQGFDSRWINWIHTILSSGKAQIVVNGAVGDQICYKHGVRQGDPLSPFLSI